MKDIPQYDTFITIEPITRGMSGDEKFYVESNSGDKYLLRLADIEHHDLKKKEYEALLRLYSLDVPMSKPVDFGYCNEGKSVYTMLAWIEGREVEKILPELNPEEQYKIGVESGKILRRIHLDSFEDNSSEWSDKYWSVIQPRVDAYVKKGIKFEGNEYILDYLEQNASLLDDRPQCFHHGDYHVGNMILTNQDELFVIDWHTVDFNNFGDPWYEFNRLGLSGPEFATGQIDGYFDDEVPEEFWKIFAFYISGSAITSIVWAKYYSPDDLDGILTLNGNILEWFDNMKKSVPTWYRRK